MVNLLFISNSTKMVAIQNALQPLLKVKIDIVADFDFGLKDVFEKRPATVFIQDQIAGVTGESVARHIQMLLGAGAPSFIFMHDGSSKAKPIKGLFEYLIDLSQPDVKAVADIQATLKSLLGTQWEKIYIPPKVDTIAVKKTLSVPEGSRAFADQLVDDFLSDLDTFGSNTPGNTFPPSDFSQNDESLNTPFQVVSSPQDQLAEMLVESCSKTAEKVTPVAVADETAIAAPVSPTVKTASAPLRPQPPEAAKDTEPSVTVPAGTEAQAVAAKNVTVDHVKPNTPEPASVPVPAQPAPDIRSIQQTSPANFVIGGENPTDEVSPEELLRVFEGSCYSQPSSLKRYFIYFIILAICAGMGLWYFMRRNPLSFDKMFSASSQPVAAVPVPTPIAPAVSAPQPVVQNPESVPLPSFIPQSALDSSFATKHPGWERYVVPTLEFRVFRVATKIKALQVLGQDTSGVTEQKLKTILKEMLGNGEYKETSRETKHGFLVSRATVGTNAELLIYRKKSVIRAFVVSID